MSGNQLDNIVDLLQSQAGSTEAFESVDTWAELPAASGATGTLYLVRRTTGVPLVNYHSSGWYRSNGATWDKLADYDPTATNSALTDIKAALSETLDVAVTNLPALQPVSDNGGSLTVDGSLSVSNLPAVQPVSDNAGSLTVDGTFWPATQPVSIAAMPSTPVTGTFFQATQPVSLASMPSTPVTGAFFQATQPISAAALPLPAGAATSAKQDTGNTSVASIDTKTPVVGQAAMAASSPVVIASNQSAVPVSGTFFQATQPVSLAVAPSTPVTGTFFQATQPVSLAVAPSTPVTGTFFQATQPVSGTVTTTPPANASTNVAQMSGTAVSMNTGVRDAGTQRVTVATNDAVPVTGTFFQATQPVSLAAAPTTPVTGTFWQATQPVSGTVTITPPTLTKGTQGATGLSTQDLKDAGRNVTNYFMAAGVAGTNAEVMQSLTGYKAGAAVAATATPAVVTAAKTYRITSITLSYQSLATAGACLFRLRANLSGTGVIGSPLVMTFTVGSLAAVAGVTNTLDIPFPDGLEFAAGTGIAVGMIGLSAVGAALAAGFGTITIYGYEY